MLDCNNKINLIKKHFVRKLNLEVYALKGIDLIIFNNKSFQTYEVYFLIIAIKDLTKTKRFFKEFFLIMNINDNLILDIF